MKYAHKLTHKSATISHSGRLRLHLGAEIDGPDRADPIARLAALETASRQLAAERDARAAEASHAQRRVRELEDELTARTHCRQKR